MFDKRLFQLSPGIGRLMAGKVACMWIGLAANIAFVASLVALLAPMLAFLASGGEGSAVPLPGDAMFHAAVIAGAAIVRYVATVISARLGTEASERVKLALRERLYRKMLALGPSYAQRVKTADVVQSAGEGIEQIQSFFELFLPQLFYAVLAPITLFVVLTPVNWPAALVLLVCAPLIVVIVGLVAMRAARVFKKYWGKYTDMGAAFLDNLQGLETLKTFDADERAARDMDRKAEEFRVMTMRVLQIQLRSLTAMDVVAYGGAAAGIGVALWQYAHTNGTYQPGTVWSPMMWAADLHGPLAYVAYGLHYLMPFGAGFPLTLTGLLFIILLSAEFFIPMRQLGSFFHVAMNGMTSTKRIFALLDTPEPEHGTATLPADADDGDGDGDGLTVAFDHVGFSYGSGAGTEAKRDVNAAASANNNDSGEPESAASVAPAASPALADITFTARPGRFTAIVGVSGSGKSTAAALLAGSLIGYHGSLALGGVEVSELSGETLAQSVTLIGARSHLFAGTLRENLLMALPAGDATTPALDDRLWAALEQARIADFVRRQPAGLDMTIEPDAANLSGGQRQRIAIARALLHDSPVFVFDEATSSVDVESEAMILDTIRELAQQRGKTVIMITHRMANAEHADQVVVLEHGRSVEIGTHDELMAAGGAYAKLYGTQADIERFAGDRRIPGLDFADANAIGNHVADSQDRLGVDDGSGHVLRPSSDSVVAAESGDAAVAVGVDSGHVPAAVGAGSQSPIASQPAQAPSQDADAAPTVERPEPTSAANPPALTTTQVVGRLLKEATPLARLMATASVSGSIGHLAATFLPVFGIIAGFALAGNPVWGMGVGPAVGGMIVCALLRGVTRYVEQYLNHNVAFHLLALFRSKAFAALRRLAPAKLAGKGKGDLIAMLTTDVELLEIFFAHTISPVVIAVTTTVVYAIVIATLNPWMALMLIASHLIIGVVIPRFFATGVHNLGPVIRGAAGQLDNVMLDDMRGLDEIIRFGRGEERAQTIEERTRALWRDHAKLSRVNGRFAGIGGLLVFLLTAIAVAVVIALASADPHRIPALTAAFVLFVSSFGPTLALSALPANLTQTFAAARRLFGIMDEAPAVVETGIATPQYAGMTLDHVTFAYPRPDAASVASPRDAEAARAAASGTAILDDFALDIPRHGVLGIQGPSGRGKSTTLKLLMRYWDPQRGRVLLSDTPLPEVDAHHRRHMQAMMSQETHLFDGTIRDNLLIALPEPQIGRGVDDGVLREALAKASVLDLVDSLPDGLDTQVGELGDRLSEGERQRIGLARVFLRHAELVLFDEPTSRLDALNEAIILRSIHALADGGAGEGSDEAGSGSDGSGNGSGAAVVLVSHRESAMRIANRVLQM